ncbi:MAG: choloylglycine hydrolase family protein [Desulfobacteraceae bacterium]|nr:choloylglycine hydrolase family protein [Desulfobacteraceae bacterium]
MRYKILFGFLVLVVFSVSLLNTAHACTGFFVRAEDGAVVYARSLEFAVPLDSKLMVIPRGTTFEATMPKGAKGAKWTSVYGILGMNFKGLPHMVDAVNEKGLQFGLYYFPGFADYKDYEPKLGTKSIASWEMGAWLLGQFASVEEVRRHIGEVHVVKVFNKELHQVIPAHYFLVDASGDSIVIEPIDKTLKVHENPVGTMTNAPTFDWHLTNLRNYIKLSPDNAEPTRLRGHKIEPLGDGSGMLGLPGDITPPSRFVRAAYYSNALAPMKTAQEALNKAMRLLQIFYIAKGMSRQLTPDGSVYIEFTEWQVYSDLKNKRLHFSTYDNLNIRMVEMAKLDFSPGPIRVMDINQPQIFEDLTGKLQ